MKSDIEIAQSSTIENITKIANKLNIESDDLILYGNDKAKINEKPRPRNGKLILMTSISPTPSGEGKTTCSIGLVDGLNKINKTAVGVLREPSMGPVFGKKGGAAGGGYSQLNPMSDINLHFTGDMHAITSANNLICACIDNHIYQGNTLHIDKDNIVIKRALDINDRTLREITIAQGSKINGVERTDGFQITVATELMAILCLSTDLDDFSNKVNKMIIAYDLNNNEVYLEQLNITGSIIAIMKDALKPNLVQTLENNPVILHGGPFANIAHGCNSIIATNYGLSKADYVVTEAGFGSDLGLEKFMNIKCKIANIKPSVVVVVATIKSLKMQAGIELDNLQLENTTALDEGFENLARHIKISKSFDCNVVVCLNKFNTDSEAEVQLLKTKVEETGCDFVINESFSKGSEGAIDFANTVVNNIKDDYELKHTYDLTDSYETKISKVCENIYGASSVKYSDDAIDKLKTISKYSNLPICIAKTPISFSGDKNLLNAPTNFAITVTDLKINNGAGFVVVYVGNILTMPGLPKDPQAMKIKYINNEIKGLS